MKRRILTFALAAAAVLLAADTASAQYPVRSYSFNPWTRTPNYQVTTYSPFGGLRTQNYAIDPWSGTRMYQSNTFQPQTGWGRTYSSAYNPWVNQYQYQYSRYNNRLPAYGYVYPAYGYPAYGW